MNDKMLACAHHPYIMQIVNIHKQAELTKKTMNLTVPLFVGESGDGPKDMQPFILHNILFIYV